MTQVERRVYSSSETTERSNKSKLTNEDFRKILMTPRKGDEKTPSRYAHLDPNQSSPTPEKKDNEKEKKSEDTRRKKRMLDRRHLIEIELRSVEMVKILTMDKLMMKVFKEDFIVFLPRRKCQRPIVKK